MTLKNNFDSQNMKNSIQNNEFSKIYKKYEKLIDLHLEN